MGSAVLLLCLAADAGAQYFGRNKVQYDADRVLVLATDHFDIYYSQEDGGAAALAARMAERWHARLSVALQHTLRGRQPIVLYGSHRRFEQTNVHGGLIDESTGGFTDSRKRRIVLPFAASLADTDHVLGHEIVHAFQFDIADQSRSPLGVPLWFVEGMAEYLTLGAGDPQTAIWMRDAVQAGKLPSIKELSSPRYFPYRWGAALWTHLVDRFGADLPARALRARRDVKRRLLEVTGQSLETLSAGWHEALREQHSTPHATASPALISNRRGGGRLNLAASLSPDGRRMVFLSERDQFSIDLFLADAVTGRVIDKLLTTATNAEFESLQYLHSAGAWDWSGTRYALGTITRGRATLIIINVDNPSDRRELPMTGVDEVYSPTWSPDGTRIAFSALAGGCQRSLRRGPREPRHPPPDRRSVCRPSARLVARRDGDRLHDRSIHDRSLVADATARTASDCSTPTAAAIVPAPSLAGINHLDPEWSGDGSLFFVGDPDGVPNVFRLDLASAGVSQVTEHHDGRGRRHAGQPRAVGGARHRRDCFQRLPQRRLRGPPHRRAFAGRGR